MNYFWKRNTWTTAVIMMLIFSVMVNGKKHKPKKENAEEDEEEVTADEDEDSFNDNANIFNFVTTTKQPENADIGAEADFATFDSIKDWMENCPECFCDAVSNENLSPVKIDTKKVIVDKKTPTLMVYSDFPPKNLYRLKYYWREPPAQEGMATPFIDALSINNGNDEERLFDETYISGLGDPSYRFFQSALILFGNTKKLFGPDRSFHQIDGKTFPMEIVLMFSTPASTDHTEPQITQIHVLVNLTDQDNPVFHPILNMMSEMKDSFGGSDHGNRKFEIEKTKGNTVRARVVLEELEQMETIEGVVLDKRGRQIGIDYALKFKQYQNRISDIGNDEVIVLTAQPHINQLDKQIVDTDKKISDTEGARRATQQLNAEVEERYTQKLETGEAVRGEDDEDLEQAKDLREELREFKSTINDLIRRRNELTIKMENEIETLKVAKRKLKKYGWKEDPKKSKYIPLAVIKKNMTHYGEQHKRKEFLKRDYEYKLAEEKKTKLDNGEVLIHDSFQISWLLPPTGGHYSYKGSGPVPPCYPRSHVIVMENHINISDAQFDLLITFLGTQTVPLLIDNLPHDPLDISVPPIYPLGDRKVTYNPKNLQFFKDDTVHMVSAERRRLKERILLSQMIAGSVKIISVLPMPTLLPLIILLTYLRTLYFH